MIRKRVQRGKELKGGKEIKEMGGFDQEKGSKRGRKIRKGDRKK